ncbi:MAG: hypothetical protein ACE5EY_10380, partial [Anaerolineae bacterium]
MKRVGWFVCLLGWLVGLSGCERPDPEVTIIAPTLAANVLPPTALVTTAAVTAVPSPTPLPEIPITRPAYAGTPTPDPPHVL